MKKTSPLPLLVLLLLTPTDSKDWTIFEPISDPSKFDYCEISCDLDAEKVDDGLHAACFCWQIPPREEIDHDIVEFRQIVLNYHNYLRNLTAGGSKVLPNTNHTLSAADMEVMNYDLELEHIARCRGINSFEVFAQEPCKRTYDKRSYVQNLGHGSGYSSGGEWVEKMVQTWYHEVALVPDLKIVDRWFETDDGETSRWSTLVWHSLNRVGCVVIHYPDFGEDNYTHHLICNYASDYVKDAANVCGSKIFTKGEPCSACAKDECNSEYTALCGELRPVPSDPPYAVMSISYGVNNWECFCFGHYMCLFMILTFA